MTDRKGDQVAGHVSIAVSVRHRSANLDPTRGDHPHPGMRTVSHWAHATSADRQAFVSKGEMKDSRQQTDPPPFFTEAKGPD